MSDQLVREPRIYCSRVPEPTVKDGYYLTSHYKRHATWMMTNHPDALYSCARCEWFVEWVEQNFDALVEAGLLDPPKLVNIGKLE